MKNIYTYILIFLFPFQVIAEEAISRSNLKFNSSNDYLERLDELEKENQNLLGRIEVLEHNVMRSLLILKSNQ